MWAMRFHSATIARMRAVALLADRTSVDVNRERLTPALTRRHSRREALRSGRYASDKVWTLQVGEWKCARGEPSPSGRGQGEGSDVTSSRRWDRSQDSMGINTHVVFWRFGSRYEDRVRILTPAQ